ncbi:putative membrane-associated kinase regulator 3 [Curcuma longa]|uniref:putative membrane-associated kinase regulator 3 n=1 Tax=Curcuma longa TaxID=136217 RepID=UPI003D9EEF39
MLMAMAVALLPCDHLLVDHNDDDDDEKYINMDLSSADVAPSPRLKEFEFKMCYKGAERDPFCSPADELFYKGKLLPLLLSPRLRMIENILDGSSHLESLVLTASTTFSNRNGSRKKNAFSEKLKLKLKASQSYLKAWFTRDPHKTVKEEELACRRSFSGATIGSSSSSSTSSSSSSSFSSSQIVLKRSNSTSSEKENSILGAVAYCKESRQQSNARMRSMAIACELQERPRPCNNTTK